MSALSDLVMSDCRWREKAKAGFKTIGFDIQSQKVEMVNAGHNYIGDVVDEDLKRSFQKDCCRLLQTSAL